MDSALFENWKDYVKFSEDGPEPYVLMESKSFKVVLVGLEPGQRIPPHPAHEAAYHILEGSGWVTVNSDRLAVVPGSTVLLAQGEQRGLEAETRLVFLGARVAGSHSGHGHSPGESDS